MIATDPLTSFFIETRKHTEDLCQTLEIEDYVVQPIDFVSPIKWHLAHTTWFFEEFILKQYKPDYKIFHKDFSYLFNSYYENVGEHFVRTNRGNLSRPSVSSIYAYRKYVTLEIQELLHSNVSKVVEDILTIGIHHEKQHQELLLTDVKYILGNNPLFPKYNDETNEYSVQKFNHKWIDISEGIYEIGHNDPEGFCYDNELGRHKVFIGDYKISNKLVTNGEYIDFIEAGGYTDFNLWHSDGWTWRNDNNISAPLYWHKTNGDWYCYSLQGLKQVHRDAPVCHISYYEAFAFAQWRDCRLPTEFEWEVAQEKFNWGLRWEWTESAYLPYPHFKKADGAIGEYNGKFMVNQKVLRGQSIATPNRHSRPTYRNFFQPFLRWQFTGLRLVQ